MPRASFSFGLALASVIALLSACADDPAPAAPAPPVGASGTGAGAGGTNAAAGAGGASSLGTAGAAGASGGTGGGGAGGSTAACVAAPDVKAGVTSTCVREVRGSLRDVAGAPLSKRTVTLCGVVCFGGSTNEKGEFTIAVNASLPNEGYAVLAHGRPDLASVIVPLPKPLSDAVVLDAPIVMHALPPAAVSLPADGAPASTVQVGALSLVIPADTSWELDPEDAVDEGAPRPMAYARVEGPSIPAFAAGSPLVVVLGPFDARPSKLVGVEITLDAAASASFAPGAAVELVTMETAVYVSGHDGGAARVLARGHVSADGLRVTTDEGEGIDSLGWLAVRALP